MNLKGRGFTLIELLIVVGILAIIGTVTVLILNPAEFLRQSRDSVRVNDLNSTAKAIDLAVAVNSNIDLDGPYANSCDGQSSQKIFVSVPLGQGTAPTPPAGWTIQQVSSANFRKPDGTGWLPVDFTNIQGSSFLAKLPIDPINTFESGDYYSYVCGSYELNANLESSKFQTLYGGKDGGDDSLVYERGSKLTHTVAFRQNAIIPAGSISVRSFGAGPEKTGAENRVALNSAFAAAADYQGKTTIVFESGVYNVSAVDPSSRTENIITVKKPSITIVGTGATLRAATTALSVLRIEANFITITDLHIDGQSNTIFGIYVRATTDHLTLSNIDVGNISEGYIYRHSPDPPVLYPLPAYDSSRLWFRAAVGIMLENDVHYTTIQNSNIHDVDASINNISRGIWFSNYNSIDFVLIRPPNNIVITGNTISNILSGAGHDSPTCVGGDTDCWWDADGIYLYGSYDISPTLVQNNTFTNNRKSAIKIDADGSATENIKVLNNTINNNSTTYANRMFSGIRVYGSNILVNGNIITGGYFRFGGLDISSLSSNISNVTISNNNISGLYNDGVSYPNNIGEGEAGVQYLYGMYVHGPFANSTISTNTMSGFDYGISLFKDSNNVTIDHNNMTTSVATKPGIYIPAEVNGVTIDTNTINGYQYGVRIWRSDETEADPIQNVFIKNNTIQNILAAAIVLSSGDLTDVAPTTTYEGGPFTNISAQNNNFSNASPLLFSAQIDGTLDGSGNKTLVVCPNPYTSGWGAGGQQMNASTTGRVRTYSTCP